MSNTTIALQALMKNSITILQSPIEVSLFKHIYTIYIWQWSYYWHRKYTFFDKKKVDGWLYCIWKCRGEKTKQKANNKPSSISLTLSLCCLGSEDWLWIVQDVWALQSYQGSQQREAMTDVVSILCLFEEASLCLMDWLCVVDKWDDFSSPVSFCVFISI